MLQLNVTTKPLCMSSLKGDQNRSLFAGTVEEVGKAVTVVWVMVKELIRTNRQTDTVCIGHGIGSIIFIIIRSGGCCFSQLVNFINSSPRPYSLTPAIKQLIIAMTEQWERHSPARELRERKEEYTTTTTDGLMFLSSSQQQRQGQEFNHL